MRRDLWPQAVYHRKLKTVHQEFDTRRRPSATWQWRCGRWLKDGSDAEGLMIINDNLWWIGDEKNGGRAANASEIVKFYTEVYKELLRDKLCINDVKCN